ncbi:MAG: putative polysaccharide biosynthesis protein [Cellulosilyticaceae bacterium]
MGKKALITGTIVLTIASLITRVLGFVFRIYMSNIMGAEGMGLYQLIFPVYMLIWSATSAGISLAISRKVSEYTAKRQHSDAIRTLKGAIVLSLCVGAFISLFLYTFAPWLSVYYLHAPDTMLSLKVMSFCIPFMCIACCIRGYFQGRQEMAFSAGAQIIEQVARMVVIYLFAGLFIPKGIAYACALGTLGLCGGEISSCLFTYTVYRIKRAGLPLSKPSLRYREVMSTLMAIAIPITANRVLVSGLSSIENILVPLQLQKGGLDSSSALSLYGMFSGMALPLLFFPSMVTMSLSTVLVPAISEAKATHNQRLLQKTVSKSIQISCLIGIGSTALFLSLGPEIAQACYKLDQVGVYLQMLAIICPFIYLQSILNGMLNGLGLQKLTFKGTLLGSAVCIICIVLLIPTKGITGFIIAMLLQSGTITCYHLFHVLKHTSVSIDLMNWIVKPALAAAAGCLGMKIILYPILLGQLSLILSTAVAVCSLALFYLILLFVFGCVTKEDVKMFF